MEGGSIGIVGTGWVGSSVAISTLRTASPRRLLLHDERQAVAEGEAMDLSHGSSFYPTAEVTAVPLAEMAGTDALVIAAGRGGRPGESRLDLLRDNARIVGDIARALVDYDGIVVVVTNPVDVLTHVFRNESGLPRERVVGTGTALDTSRLRQALAAELRVDPRSVHAQVLGEHGDSEVFLWSGASVGGARLRSWPGWSSSIEEGIAADVRDAAYRIIERKGATNHAIGLVTADLLRGMLRDERRVMTVSTVQTGALGIDGVALSLPTVVGSDGATTVIEPEIDEAELAALDRSGSVLRDALDTLRDGAVS